MKRVKMIVTSVVVLAIVGSAFAFNAKKIGKFCVTDGTANQNCYTIVSSKRTTVAVAGVTKNLTYVVDWDGATCSSTSSCGTQATFTAD